YRGVALNSNGTQAVLALGSPGIVVVNLTNTANPAIIGSYATGGTAYAVAFDSATNLAYIADGVDFQIVNLSNPRAPTRSGSLNLGGTELGVAGARGQGGPAQQKRRFFFVPPPQTAAAAAEGGA